ncbi:MAG TPA: hypothetical protein VLL82_12400 [Mycobacterium sp.]|nr:hypothetical protein [Mycobacterium sp.]
MEPAVVAAELIQDAARDLGVVVVPAPVTLRDTRLIQLRERHIEQAIDNL